MKEDYLDIVAVIVRQIAAGEGRGPRDRSIIEGLLDDGYDLMDIDDALSWFESLGDSAGDLEAVEFWPGFMGFRVQARWERDAMSQNAFAYLMKLNSAGLVDDAFREAILDKVMEMGIGGFGLAQMKAFLGLVLYTQGAFSPEESVYRLVDRGPDSMTH
ncbi:MAG: DUF494 family protein [Nitrospirae bacterium]|nr:DUF494 family protein [Nitrospirota bacterium]